ncbi:MAG: methyltransferase domain-containing protein [Reyranella sp.]
MIDANFQLEDIPHINEAIFGNAASDEERSLQTRRFLRIPSWVDPGLDPFSPAYRQQQMRLWHAISGRSAPYDPWDNELTHATDAGIKRPGVYGTNDASVVGDHTIAQGHILLRSGIKAGDSVLEYGPGYGQLALAFARLGAVVDAVEVDPDFHRIVNSLAGFYDVDLRCHRGLFGFVPPDRTRFDLIVFYESFHHCWEFQSLVRELPAMLSSKGRILMAGEPIVPDGSPHVPYPWGLRLDAENVCIVRQRGWMELGFQESFIERLFRNAGFSWKKHPSGLSHHSVVYEAAPISRRQHTDIDAASFLPEENTKGATRKMDSIWHEVATHVRAKSSSDCRFVVPDSMLDLVEDGIPYSSVTGGSSRELGGLVIHKGLYKEIAPNILFDMLRRLVPTLANAVFVVLETTGPRLPSRHVHLGMLTEIRQWAAANADPEIARSEAIGEPEGRTGDRVLSLMVDFIVENLAKPMDPTQAEPVIAIAETAERFDDTAWFWTDDTAKTAELFALPRVRDAYPDLAKAMVDHVLRLSPDLIIHRRAALPELKLVSGDPRDFRAYNSIFNLSGNLTRGVVCPSIRFNDGRTLVAAEYSGNMVEFTYRWRRQTVDIEDSISRWSVDEQSDRIVFSHTSAIAGKPLLGAARHVCDVTYSYTLWRARSTVELSVSVDVAQGVTLRNFKVTTGFDQLSRTKAFGTVIVGRGDVFETSIVRDEPRMLLATGKADYASVFESYETPGFALGLHAHLKDGDRLEDIVAEGSFADRFHWIHARYRLGTIPGGGTRGIVEDRLLTGGGYYDRPAHYRRMIIDAESADGHVDPGMSYDVGAELNAVATTILFAEQGRYSASPPGQGEVQALKSWFDRHLDIYLDVVRPAASDAKSRIFVRGLSFVILALDCMARAYENSDYRSKLDICVQLLLRLEVPVPGGDEQSLYSIHTPEDIAPPQLDCQCAAILALARAACWSDPNQKISASIRRGLRAIQIVTVNGAQYGAPDLTYDTILIRKQADGTLEDTGFWNFKLGLALRAFKAVRLVQDLGFLTLDSASLAYLADLTERASEALRPSFRPENGTMEVLTSQRSGETNSETQPWVALGLVPAIELEILGRPTDATSMEDVPAPNPLPRASSRCDFDKSSPAISVEWQCSELQAPRLLARIAEQWERLGESKPHWSVLTEERFLPERITETEEAFFSSGQHDRNRLLATIARVGRDPAEFRIACEFGCGLGRVTNHLAESFERVIACDVSRSHLVRARARSHEIGRGNITYRVSMLPHFGMTMPFDLWFSIIVLQHNPPPIMAMILQRMLRLLRPGGLAVFQVPTYAPGYEFNVDEYLTSPVAPGGIETHYLPQPSLFRIIDDAGGLVTELVEDGYVGIPGALSNTVVVTKK